jgi:uncharacterized protein with GYD domain
LTAYKREKNMTEYLVLMRLNSGKIAETLGDIRKLDDQPVSGVDLCYSMNIFGAWDVGVWIKAENSTEVLEFVQNKIRHLSGITDVYTVPTFPHGNAPAKKKATA